MTENNDTNHQGTKFGEGTRVDPDEAEKVRQKKQAEKDKENAWENPKNWDELKCEVPPELIKGVFYAGTKMGVAAGSKSLKTWLLMYLSYCIANGFDFLGYPTKQARVGYFDFELPEFAIRQRFGRIRGALGGKGNMDNLKIWALRGKVRKFRSSSAKFVQIVRKAQIEIAIIDPIYKFLIGKNESDNSMVASLLEDLAEYCDQTGIAIVYVHHHSKGNQAQKDAIDRTSGAGTWGRDPDTLLDLTEHETSTPEANVLTVEFITRLFERPPKFVVRWDFPLLVRDGDGLNPEDLKQPKRAGRPKKDLAAELLAVLRIRDPDGGASAKELSDSTLVTTRTVQRRLKELMPQRIVKSPANGTYQLSLAERTRWEEFKKTT